MVAVYTEKLNAQTVQFLFETFIFATAKIVCSNVTEQNNSVAGFRINLFYKSRDGKKQFIILIQDISIEKNACAEKLKATLRPDSMDNEKSDGNDKDVRNEVLEENPETADTPAPDSQNSETDMPEEEVDNVSIEDDSEAETKTGAETEPEVNADDEDKPEANDEDKSQAAPSVTERPNRKHKWWLWVILMLLLMLVAAFIVYGLP